MLGISVSFHFFYGFRSSQVDHKMMARTYSVHHPWPTPEMQLHSTRTPTPETPRLGPPRRSPRVSERRRRQTGNFIEQANIIRALEDGLQRAVNRVTQNQKGWNGVQCPTRKQARKQKCQPTPTDNGKPFFITILFVMSVLFPFFYECSIFLLMSVPFPFDEYSISF